MQIRLHKLADHPGDAETYSGKINEQIHRRSFQHIFGKKSFAKIAASEGKAKNTIQESYDAAIKKMKKFLKNTLPKDLPYSE